MRVHTSRTRFGLAVVAALVLAAIAQAGAEVGPQVGAQSAAKGPAAPAAPEIQGHANPLATAKSWGYQLDGMDVDRASSSPHDMIVIDYSSDGTDAGALTAAEVEKLKQKPDGGRRIVLAYLSIGEAEDYRFYWRWYWGYSWGVFAPGWRAAHNDEWPGNYAVRYWQQGWQQLMIGAPRMRGYLDRIIAADFDGVYLDKIDSFLEAVGRENPNARSDMITFVRRIADKGRAMRPGFLIVPQNGEELLTSPGYRALIDGLGKEDLLYGEFKHGLANPPDVIERRLHLLGLLTGEGKPVFAVEYLDDPALIAEARARLTASSLRPHFANRDLQRMRFGDLEEATLSR